MFHNNSRTNNVAKKIGQSIFGWKLEHLVRWNKRYPNIKVSQHWYLNDNHGYSYRKLPQYMTWKLTFLCWTLANCPMSFSAKLGLCRKRHWTIANVFFCKARVSITLYSILFRKLSIARISILVLPKWFCFSCDFHFVTVGTYSYDKYLLDFTFCQNQILNFQF